MEAWDAYAPVSYTHLDVYKRQVLESVEDISITVGYQPPVSEYQLTVSRDKMKVILKTKFRPGTVFKLCDADFQQRLVIKSKPAGTLPAKPIDPRLVLAELQRAGVKAEFIDTQQVIKACLGCCDAEVVVAPVSYTHLDVYKRQGTQSTSPGKIRLGLGMWGLAAMRALRETPKRWAMKNMVSPCTTVYLPVNPGGHCFGTRGKPWWVGYIEVYLLSDN